MKMSRLKGRLEKSNNNLAINLIINLTAAPHLKIFFSSCIFAAAIATSVQSLSANPIISSKQSQAQLTEKNKQTSPAPSEVLIPVKQILVVGSSILTTAEIDQITKPHINKS